MTRAGATGEFTMEEDEFILDECKIAQGGDSNEIVREGQREE